METKEYRSMFWPIVLIGVGVVALLVNLNVIEAINLGALLRYWPLLLIIAGIDVLLSRAAPALGIVLGIAVVGGVLALLIAGPGATGGSGNDIFILTGDLNVTTETLRADLADAQEASIRMDLRSGPTTVDTQDDQSDLLIATVTAVTPVELRQETENDTRFITLDAPEGVMTFSGSGVSASELPWDITLRPDIPTALNVDVGSGSATLNLADLALTSLTLEGGPGTATVALPGGEQDVQIDVGSGAINVAADDLISGIIEMEDGGSGTLTLTLPAGLPVRVEVIDGGSGTVRRDRAFEQVDGDDGDDEGAWETPNYSEDEGLLIVIDDLGSGDVVIELGS